MVGQGRGFFEEAGRASRPWPRVATCDFGGGGSGTLCRWPLRWPYEGRPTRHRPLAVGVNLQKKKNNLLREPFKAMAKFSNLAEGCACIDKAESYARRVDLLERLSRRVRSAQENLAFWFF